MKLSSYLQERKLTLRQFAAMVGVANASVVYKWVAGNRVPRAKHMSAIVRETEGKVQPNDFFGAP